MYVIRYDLSLPEATPYLNVLYLLAARPPSAMVALVGRGTPEELQAFFFAAILPELQRRIQEVQRSSAYASGPVQTPEELQKGRWAGAPEDEDPVSAASRAARSPLLSNPVSQLHVGSDLVSRQNAVEYLKTSLRTNLSTYDKYLRMRWVVCLRPRSLRTPE